jgi:hypothetical protein
MGEVPSSVRLPLVGMMEPNRVDRDAIHLFDNAEDDGVLRIVVKTYPIAMLTMQFRRYFDIGICKAFL